MSTVVPSGTWRGLPRWCHVPRAVHMPLQSVAYCDRVPRATNSNPGRRILVYGVTGSGKEHGRAAYRRTDSFAPHARRRAHLGAGLVSRRRGRAAPVLCNSRRSGPLGPRHRVRCVARRRPSARGSGGRARLPTVVLAPACLPELGDARDRQETDLQREH